MSYRKIWETIYGPIPKGYEIHHIDGNRMNNDIENLRCVSIEEHYEIHYKQGDYLACTIMSKRMGLSEEERKVIHDMAMKKRDQTGSKNPMYGRSAIKENNMKWYNNGTKETMFVEGNELEGFTKGRLYYPEYDKSGSNNPKAKPAIVNGKRYECLKDALVDYPHIPYSSLKKIVKSNKKNNKHGIKAEYV